MSRLSTALLGVVVLFASVDAQLAVPPSRLTDTGVRQQAQVDTMDLLDRYSGGDFAAAVELGIPFSARWAHTYEREASAWIARAPEDTGRRRLVVAALLIEVVRAQYEEDWSTWNQMRDLLEWACSQLRRSPDTVPGEQAWHRAMASLAQRAYDWAWLERTHLRHSTMRFPEDVYFPLAAALVRADSADDAVERRIRPYLGEKVRGRDPLASSASDPRIVKALDQETHAAVSLLRSAIDDPAFGPFLETRVSHLYLMNREYASALQHAGDAAARSSDPRIRYLANILVGQSFERLRRAADAERAYRAALQELPGGQSAVLALVALSAPQPGDGLHLPASGQDEADDPYRLYPYGTYLYWSDFITALRRAIHA